MKICQVVGHVWSTRKTEKLTGQKFMIVEPIDSKKEENALVAADVIGAGIGEKVLVAFGKAARLAVGDEKMCVDAAIVGILDEPPKV